MKHSKITLLVLFITFFSISAQSPWERIAQRPSTLYMEQGSKKYVTKSFSLTLVNASQTVERLAPHADTSFDYVPGDRIDKRDKDGM